MPTLNVRLATIIFVVVVVVGGGVHLLHGYQVGRQAYALQKASQRAEVDKNLDEAIRLLQNYVTLAPGDRVAELHLGVLYADAHNVMPAYRFLEDGLRRADASVSAEDMRTARRKLVDVAIILGRNADAQAHLDVLMEGAVEKNRDRRAKGEPPQGDPQLLEQYGQVLTYSARDKEARDVFQDAIAIAPQQINAYMRLAILLRFRLDQKAEADAVIEAMMKNNSTSLAAYNQKAYYFLEQEKYDVALDAAQQALKLVPDDPSALLNAGRCCFAKGKYEEAETYLRRGMKAAKDDRSFYIVLADVLTGERKPKEAIEILKQGAEATKGSRSGLEITWKLANALALDRQFAEARGAIKELRDGQFPPPLIDFIEAEMAFYQQDWKTAEPLLRQAVATVDRNPDVRRKSYLYLAECYRQEGREKEQVLALNEAKKVDPFMYQAHVALAEYYLSKRKLDDAVEEYRQLLRTPQKDEAMLSMARILIMERLQLDKEKRDWQPVDELLDQLMAKKVIRPDIVVLKAEVLLAKSSEATDDSASDEAAQQNRRLAAARIKQAAALLKACTDKVPKNAEGWLARIRLSMHLAGMETDAAKKTALWKETQGLIDDAEKNLGDGVTVRMARGSLAVRSNDPLTVELLKKLGENISAMSEGEKLALWGVLGTLAVEANDIDLARANCRLVAEKEPKNVRIRYLLCELDLRAYENGRAPDMRELDQLVSDIERLGGQGPYWLYAKAIRALVQSQGKDPQLLLEARGDLRDAMETRPDWSALAVLSGKICELQDEPDQALELYTRAIHFMNERDNDVIGRTVRLLVPRGRLTEAKELFDYLEKQKSPLVESMHKEYVYVKVFMGDIDAAEKEVDDYVAANDANYKNFAWQGQMYGILVGRRKARAIQRQADKSSDDWKSDPDMLKVAQKGVNALLRAHQLNLQAEEVSVALVRQLIQVGRPEKAQPLIADMKNTLQGDKALVTIGYCCELLNDTAGAEEKYEAAVAAAPHNCRVLRQAAAFYLRYSKNAQAEPLLNTIISLEGPATLTDACWARRNLAMVLKSRGDFDNLCKAIALLDQNLASKAACSDDKRCRVAFLIDDPRKEKTNEAIAGMENLIKAPDATADDYFALAQLYLKKGDQAAFEEQMRNVLGASRPRPQYLVFYIGLLLDRKNFPDADQLLQTLEKMAPNSFDTLRLRAEYLFRRGQPKAAAELAMNYLDRPQADRGQQIYNVATLLEGFAGRLKAENNKVDARSFDAKAEELFVSLRSKTLAADGDVIYAAYLARQKRIRESLDLLQLSPDTKRFDVLQMAAGGILESHAATPAQIAQLQTFMESVASKNGRPVVLLAILAKLYDQQGQHDKAQGVMREVLAKEPRNYRALNNLGLDLARNGGDLDEALKLVNQALAISGPMAVVLDSRAIVYIARKEYDKALDDLNAAVGDEGSAEQYFHLAWALSLLDRKTEAAAAFAKATEKGLDRDRVDTHEAVIFDRLKDIQ